MLLLRLSGVFLLPLAERHLLALLFHDPPRSTRSGAPRIHPLAKTRAVNILLRSRSVAVFQMSNPTHQRLPHFL